MAKVRSDIDDRGDRYNGRGKDKLTGEDSVETLFSIFDGRGDADRFVARNILDVSIGSLMDNLLLFLL